MIIFSNISNIEKQSKIDFKKGEINIIHMIFSNAYIFINFKNDDEKNDIFNYIFIGLDIEKFEDNIKFVKKNMKAGLI